jgi:hypothetical protein
MPAMALGSGTGLEAMRHIAMPMVGGIASETVVTLAILPAVSRLGSSTICGTIPNGGFVQNQLPQNPVGRGGIMPVRNLPERPR